MTNKSGAIGTRTETAIVRHARAATNPIRRVWCRLAHRRTRIDDGPRAVWCWTCGQAVGR